jgi:hypothetical protein
MTRVEVESATGSAIALTNDLPSGHVMRRLISRQLVRRAEHAVSAGNVSPDISLSNTP